MKLEISICDISFIIVVVFIHRFFLFFKVQWKIIWRKVAPLLNIESKKFLIFSLLAPIKSFLFTNYTSFDPFLISPCRRLKYILIIRDRKFRSRELVSITENVTPFLLSKLSSRLLMAYQQNRLFPLKTKKSNISVDFANWKNVWFNIQFQSGRERRNKWSKEIRLLCEKSGNAPRFLGCNFRF